MQSLLVSSALSLLVSSAVANPLASDDSPFLVRRGGTDDGNKLTESLLHGSNSQRSLQRQGSGGSVASSLARSASSVSSGVGFEKDDRFDFGDKSERKAPESKEEALDNLRKFSNQRAGQSWMDKPPPKRPHSAKSGDLGHHLRAFEQVMDERHQNRKDKDNIEWSHNGGVKMGKLGHAIRSDAIAGLKHSLNPLSLAIGHGMGYAYGYDGGPKDRKMLASHDGEEAEFDKQYQKKQHHAAYNYHQVLKKLPEQGGGLGKPVFDVYTALKQMGRHEKDAAERQEKAKEEEEKKKQAYRKTVLGRLHTRVLGN